jgi:hypothetical protein
MYHLQLFVNDRPANQQGIICEGFCYKKVETSGVSKGGRGFKHPRNSEVLLKLSRIPIAVEYTSITT